MAKKKDINEEINDFLASWDCERMISFLREIIPLFELYDVEDENDWVKDAVGEENERNVRLIRTGYLMSRIPEFHSGRLWNLSVRFKQLWQRMEKLGMEGGQPCGGS